MKAQDSTFYLRKVAQGIFISLFFLAILFAPGRNVIVAQMLLYETMPNYKMESDIKILLGLNDENTLATEVFAPTVLSIDNSDSSGIRVVGLTDDIYRQSDKAVPEEYPAAAVTAEVRVDEISSLEELRNKFYVVDRRTGMTPVNFNVSEFMDMDLTIDRNGSGPKILVFHTHSTELFADSIDETEGVLGLGRELCNVLEEKYGIETIHVRNRFDIVDGRPQILGAYERMEPDIKRILAENPSIEMVIDLHRDGVESGRRLVTEINGKPTAQIMFVNGLSKIYNNGTLTPIGSLPNPNLKTNLALSFRAQLAANKLYPGFARKIYLNAYRYSLHMRPKSMLIEVGAQTNTKEEAFNAIEPLADILAAIILDDDETVTQP